MPEAFNYSVRYTGASGDCVGYMFSCEATHQLVLVFDEPCGSHKKVEIFNCLGSFADQRKQYIITESSKNSSDLHCWIRRPEVQDGNFNNMYLLRPADCHDDTLANVEYRNYPILASFLFERRTDDTDELCTENYTQMSFPFTTTPSIPTTTTQNPWIHVPDVDGGDVLWENITGSGRGSTTRNTINFTDGMFDSTSFSSVTPEFPPSSTGLSSWNSTVETSTVLPNNTTTVENISTSMDRTTKTSGTTSSSPGDSATSVTFDDTTNTTAFYDYTTPTDGTVTSTDTTEFWSGDGDVNMTTTVNYSGGSTENHSISSEYFTTPRTTQESTTHGVDSSSREVTTTATTTTGDTTTTPISTTLSTSTTIRSNDNSNTTQSPVAGASNRACNTSVKVVHILLILMILRSTLW